MGPLTMKVIFLTSKNQSFATPFQQFTISYTSYCITEVKMFLMDTNEATTMIKARDMTDWELKFVSQPFAFAF